MGAVSSIGVRFVQDAAHIAASHSDIPDVSITDTEHGSILGTPSGRTLILVEGRLGEVSVIVESSVSGEVLQRYSAHTPPRSVLVGIISGILADLDSTKYGMTA